MFCKVKTNIKLHKKDIAWFLVYRQMYVAIEESIYRFLKILYILDYKLLQFLKNKDKGAFILKIPSFKSNIGMRVLIDICFDGLHIYLFDPFFYNYVL